MPRLSFVNWSVITSTGLFPRVAFGKGPRRSFATRSSSPAAENYLTSFWCLTEVPQVAAQDAQFRTELQGIIRLVRPILLPTEVIIHSRKARMSCQARVMGKVQYFRPEPFRYNPLQSPIEGGLADEKAVPVDIVARVRVPHGPDGRRTEEYWACSRRNSSTMMDETWRSSGATASPCSASSRSARISKCTLLWRRLFSSSHHCTAKHGTSSSTD